jgi:putative membrane protein
VSQQLVPSRVDLDSRARTLLANERTFLAWLRTGLSLVAAGLAVANFLPVGVIPGLPYVRIYSVLLVVSGTTLVLIGGVRARRASRRIDQGMTVSSPAGLWGVAVIAGILCAMALPLIFGLR